MQGPIGELHLRAHAKINLLLRIRGRRPDGYHDLETLFQSISLHDELTLAKSDCFEFRCDDPAVPKDETNLVVRAARAMSSALNLPPVRIHLRKHIPSGGGLGGGSADAAMTMIGLLRLFGKTPAADHLHQIASSLGSDVPFFLVGGAAFARGRGELLTPLPDVQAVPLLLLIPDVEVSTSAAFSSWSSLTDRNESRENLIDERRARAIVGGGYRGYGSLLVNDFESVVFPQLPQLERLKMLLCEAGAFWCGMTGSGSTIVGAFGDSASRDHAAAALAGEARVEPAFTVSRESALNLPE